MKVLTLGCMGGTNLTDAIIIEIKAREILESFNVINNKGE